MSADASGPARTSGEPQGGGTMENVADTAGGKKRLRERAFGELEKYAVITVYLCLLFALFSLHKQLVQGHGISLWHQGFARCRLLTEAAIFFVALIPFFAFQEAARILGNGVLWDLFFHSGEKRFRLIEI
jgi:hypothetical protein